MLRRWAGLGGSAGRVPAVLMLAGMLAACGFHLKQATELAPVYANLYVNTPDRYSDLDAALRQILSESGATLRSERGVGAVLEIVKDESGRRIISVSVRNVPTEYEVYYNVTYRVAADGKDLIPTTEITTSRVIAYSESTELAREQEELIVREALARDLAERILRRLSAP